MMSHIAFLAVALLLPLTALAGQAGDNDPVSNGQPLSYWINELTSTQFDRQMKAHNAIRELKAKAAPAVPALLTLLTKTSNVNQELCDTLGTIGPAAKKAVPELFARFDKKKPEQAGYIAAAIARIDPASSQCKTTIVQLMERQVQSPQPHAPEDRFISDTAQTLAPFFTAWLDEKDPTLRRTAAVGLLLMNEHFGHSQPGWTKVAADANQAAAKALTMALKDEDLKVRHLAVLALDRIDAKAHARQIVPVVVDLMLKEKIEPGRVEFLIREAVPEATPLLIAALEHSGQFGPAYVLSRYPKVALPAVTAALSSASAKQRAGAAWSLGMMRAAAQPAVPQLLPLLQDGDINVRFHAANALVDVEPKQLEAALVVLAAILKNGSAVHQQQTARRFRELGPRAKSAVPALVETVQTAPAGELRMLAVEALLAVDPSRSAAVLAALTDAVRDTASMDMKYRALKAASRLGPAAKPLIPDVLPLLKSTSPGIQIAAAEAAVAIDSSHADMVVAVLGPMASSKKTPYDVRQNALKALGRLGALAKGAAPGLSAALEVKSKKDQLDGLWPEIAETLLRIDTGKGSDAANAVLRQKLTSKDEDEQADALDAVKRLGPLGKGLVKELAELVQDPKSHCRARAAEMLGLIGPDAKAAIPTLQAALKDNDFSLRTTAAQSLVFIEGKK